MANALGLRLLDGLAHEGCHQSCRKQRKRRDKIKRKVFFRFFLQTVLHNFISRKHKLVYYLGIRRFYYIYS